MASASNPFAALSVDGHKQNVARQERQQLQEKLMKRAEQQRVQASMSPAAGPPKPVHVPAATAAAFNKALHQKEATKERLAVMKIQSKVDRYYEYFGDSQLKNRKRRAFTSNTTLMEATEELHSIEAQLASSNCYNNVENLYCYMADGISQWGPSVGLRTHNAAKILKDEDHLAIVQPELMEISVKYEEWFSQGPLVRFMQKVIFMVRAIHNENIQMEIKSLQSQPAPEVMDQYRQQGL